MERWIVTSFVSLALLGAACGSKPSTETATAPVAPVCVDKAAASAAISTASVEMQAVTLSAAAGNVEYIDDHLRAAATALDTAATAYSADSAVAAHVTAAADDYRSAADSIESGDIGGSSTFIEAGTGEITAASSAVADSTVPVCEGV